MFLARPFSIESVIFDLSLYQDMEGDFLCSDGAAWTNRCRVAANKASFTALSPSTRPYLSTRPSHFLRGIIRPPPSSPHPLTPFIPSPFPLTTVRHPWNVSFDIKHLKFQPSSWFIGIALNWAQVAAAGVVDTGVGGGGQKGARGQFTPILCGWMGEWGGGGGGPSRGRRA